MISDSVVLDAERLKREVDYFHSKGAFFFDYETVGEHRGVPQKNQITWLSMSTFGRTIVVPMGHPNGNVMLEPPRKRKNRDSGRFDMFPAVWDEPPTQLRPSQVFGILEPMYFDPDVDKIAHGALFDVLSQAKYYGNELVPGPYHCSLTQSWILDENKRNGLKDITERRYKRVYDAEHVGRKVEIHPFNKVARYAFLDAKYGWLHHRNQMEMLEDQGLLDVYRLEMEVFRELLDIGMHGQPVDVETMHALEPVLAKRKVEDEARVYKAAGKKFNLNSPKQKVDVLYGTKADGNQGLRPWKLTKGGFQKQKKGLDVGFYDYSTDAESLETHTGNPVVDAILQFQEVDRVLGTYIHGYMGFSHPTDSKKSKPCIIFDGKVYPEFVPYGTVTGRFSCRTPNLQNIPRPDTDLGRQVRSLFVAGPGHKLIVSDYGQVELVVLAHFVGKGALYEGFFQGIDPHTMTAAMVFGVDPHDLTQRIKQEDPEAKAWRQIAKNLNFAIVYGAGPDKVASMSKVSVRKAKGFLRTHENQFPEIYAFKDKAIQVCRSRKPPYLSTLAGRRRRVPAIMSRDWGTKGRAERQAINSLVQGSAADLIKVAMVRTGTAMRESGAGNLLLTVHDELVCRAPDARADEAAVLLREAMVGPGIQEMVDVPLAVDLKVVDRWSEAK